MQVIEGNKQTQLIRRLLDRCRYLNWYRSPDQGYTVQFVAVDEVIGGITIYGSGIAVLLDAGGTGFASIHQEEMGAIKQLYTAVAQRMGDTDAIIDTFLDALE